MRTGLPPDIGPVTTLVAGVGNIFLRDDGFGSEVTRRMADVDLPPGTAVMDYGIGGIHLAYDLLDGVELLVLVDALPGDTAPGTLTVFEADAHDLPDSPMDSHAMDPAAVLDAVERRAGDRPVERIGVRVGQDLHVLPEVFEQGFQVLAQGGVADGATTEVESVEGDVLVLTWVRYRSPAAAQASADADVEGS